ncbi:carboxypeptidase-like regulatory domain-containing protein [Sulfurifustis variabilis]|uniref:carboxypeptidase-like regulatory domain-containing protein n=1 Tax=Sulfurifustis variabilis TaxID=1675686 RepID=UPI0011E4CA80|nr:carboxypeptidase-like regulatory domain-containing protein [Sulfurifustis variabilis]
MTTLRAPKCRRCRHLSNVTIVSAAVSIFGLSSCIAVPIPHERKLTPHYYGTVSDASTGAPIEFVTVSVAPISHVDRSISAETKTDLSGHYEISIVEKAKWFVLMAGPAEGNCGGILLFLHPDYDIALRETSEFRGGAIDGACRGAKSRVDVSLTRKTLR